MPLQINNSPDITLLDFAILYDISGATPSITLTNQSVGNPNGTINLDNCTWWYTIITPLGIYIHAGSQVNPDVTSNNWTTLVIPEDSWPTPFGKPPYGQIDFSCASPYVATLYVIDSINNVYQLQKQQTICRPNGNTDNSKGNFGVAATIMNTNCSMAQVYANDTTNYTYQNKLGTSQNSTWTFTYPVDANGNLPDPFIITNKPSVIFPVQYSAKGYGLYLNTFCTYVFQDSQSIKVQYKFQAAFNVFCNVDFGPVQCEIDKMYALLTPKCGTVDDPELKDRLLRIQVLMNKAQNGVLQPLLGIDVPATLEQIKKLGNFDCDCGCGLGGGINPIGNNTGVIQLDTEVVGDITAEFTNTGNNYVLHIELPGGGGIPNLQQVSDKGNITTKNLIVGALGSKNTTIFTDHIIMTDNESDATKTLAGIGRLTGADAFGTLWLHYIGYGTVYMRPAVNSNSYSLILPNDQGGAGTVQVNDGAGNMSWQLAGGANTLQTVTTGAGNNVTTNDMFSGSVAGSNGRVSPQVIGVYAAGILVAGMSNAAGAGGGQITLRDFSSGRVMTLNVPILAANRALVFTGVRSGNIALSGVGTSVSVIVGPNSGVGATVNLEPNSNDTGGRMQILCGPGATLGVIAYINLSTAYMAAGISPHPLINPVQNVATGVSDTRYFPQVISGGGPGGVDRIGIVATIQNPPTSGSIDLYFVITY